MLSSIFSAIGMQIVDAFLGKALEAFKSYNEKTISIEELRTKVSIAMMESFKQVEVTHAEVLAKTYASFMQALVQSRILQWVWAAVVLSQLFVLVWSQFFVPLLYAYGYLPNWKAGTTGDWAYLLIGACIGLGPMVLRAGPAGGSIMDQLKSIVGKK
jgi:hypothetical protein